MSNRSMFGRPSAALIAAAAVAVAAAGCNRGPRMADVVEGTVTLDGKPLENLRVEFWPLTDGPQSAALTDAQGRFSLSTLDGERKGAVVGMHKVVLRDVSIVGMPFHGRANENVDVTGGKKPRISDKYTNVTKTPLQVEVAGDTTDITLAVDPYGAPGGTSLKAGAR